MANLKELRNRISSVASTQKITRAMQMVAASKLRKAQDAVESTRPYSDKLFQVVGNLSCEMEGDDNAPKLLVGNGKSQRYLFVIATSERGLCGGFNSSITRLASQKARELIDSDLIGDIKLGNAIFAFPGVESFHPKPESWYKKEGGPVIDMGPYFFTTLVNLLGPAKQVQGRTLTAFKKRIYGVGPKKNKSFKVETPTTYLATIQFHSGAIIQVTLSFDVINHQRNHMELYGTKGSIIVPDPNMFGGSVFISVTEGGKWGEHKTDKMHLGKINITSSSGRSNEAATNANYRSVGLSEMLYSIQKNKKHRCSGDLSLHVLDIIESTMRAANTGIPQKIQTKCDKPKKFTEEEVKKILI